MLSRLIHDLLEAMTKKPTETSRARVAGVGEGNALPTHGSVVTTKPMRSFSVASLDERRVSSAHSRTKRSEQQHCGERKGNRSKLCNIYFEEKG